MFLLLVLLTALLGCESDCPDGFVTFLDHDGDGFGDPAQPTEGCAGPVNNTDCDDTNPAIHPDATETCSTPGIDDDCDGLIDDADVAVDGAGSLHADADGDGYGATDTIEVGCPSAGLVVDATDCDDSRAWAYPGAIERCDGADTDCDPATGEDGLVSWFGDDGAVEDWTATFGGTATTAHEVMVEDAGDLEVCAGTWYTRVELAAEVHLEAPAGAALTTLDGAGGGTVVSIHGAHADTEVSGFTLTGGNAAAGGGLSCSGGATLAVYDTEFVNNYATRGGAVYSDDCTVYLWYGHILDNAAEEGGGAWVHDGHFEFNGVPVARNTASIQGGALMVAAGADYTYASVSETVFEENSAPRAGAIALTGTAELQIFATTIDRGGVLNNTSETGGVVTTDLNSMVEFIVADLGEPGTEDDNFPTDVSTPAGDWDYGNDVTTWCKGTGCVEE